MDIIFLIIGAILGVCSRHYLSIIDIPNLPYSQPIIILLINIIGCLLMGFWFDIQTREYKLLLTTGFLGSFTTFSAFAKDSYNLWSVHYIFGIIYIMLSVILGLSAFLLGKYIRSLI